MLRRRRSKECQRRKKTKLISGRTVTSRESEEPTYMHGENNTERRSDTESVPSAPKRVVKPEKKQQVQVFVETTFRKGVQGLIEEFRSMKRTNDFTLMKEFVAQNAYGRNRYKDVGCLDNRRVVIRIGNVPYIHANYVATPNHPKRFICTQNVKKCAEYFPTDPGGCLDFDGVRVVCKKQDYFQFPIETKVQVRMTFLDVYGPSCPVHSCIHYHWLDWPDRGVPEADLTPIALLSKLKNSAGTYNVHRVLPYRGPANSTLTTRYGIITSSCTITRNT
ncbi:Protein-tyrosine phosphatase [Cooperia oncophora]